VDGREAFINGFVVHGGDLFAGEDAPGFHARVPGSFFGGFGMIASEDFGAMGCCGKWI
jgi:hypothetical protein